jgi:hypothetical protein
MIKELNDILSCPVIKYTSFKENEYGDMNNSTTITKFKQDMKTLLDNGYKSMSLIQMHEIRHANRSCPQKAFCLVFTGGYLNNYTLAFPVIKQLNIYADIFVSTDLMGLYEYPGRPDFTPHFGWEEAREMHDGGLINIFALWHPFDENKADTKENIIKEKISQIIGQINDDAAKSIFSFEKIDDKFIGIANRLGITINLIDYYSITLKKVQAGCVPSIYVNYNSDILDIIDNYKNTCKTFLERDTSVLNPDIEQQISEWNNEEFETIILPIEKQPLIRNYLRHAFPLSVLAAERKEKAECLVLNEYIDVVFRPWYHWFDYDNHLYDSWDCISCRRISSDIIRENNIYVISYIINGLKLKYYSDLWLDTYYIPGKPGYGSTHLTHCLLVYGYDKGKNVLNTLSYTDSGMYENLNVSVYDIIRACSNQYFQYINLLKRNDNSIIEYDIHILSDKLYKYINSIYSYDGNTKYNKKNGEQFCNFKACEAFSEYIKNTAEKEKKIYIVALYGFVEYKKCMAWRLKYICERQKIRCSEVDLFDEYITQKCEILLNICIKYNRTVVDSLIDKIVLIIDEMVVKEKSAILSLLEKLNI